MVPLALGKEVVWELIGSKAHKTGAMVHLATEEVDRGPVVSYVTVPITGPLFDQHWESLKGRDPEVTKQNEGKGVYRFSR
ncbi:MAG: hypothetical protein Ct9H300mP11_16550 [Chloroflexota bacterium]|nr:MAG: hypothetical protein Ct9H300mP11_16550 [Chloroflexota bacterium]